MATSSRVSVGRGVRCASSPVPTTSGHLLPWGEGKPSRDFCSPLPRGEGFSNPFTQCLPLQKLHGNEGLPFEFTDVMNRADVGMIEGRGRLRFALETLQSLAISSEHLGQKFERNKPVQPCVFGFVDHT